MNQTSVRKVEGDTAPSKELRIAALRAQMAQIAPVLEPDHHQHSEHSQAEQHSYTEQEIVALGADLRDIFPHGGLKRRAVALMDSPALLAVEMLAHISSAGLFSAVLGWPELSYAGISESGGQLDRIIAVPEPGAQIWEAAAILAEGLDAIFINSEQATLTPSRARPFLAKVRHGKAAVIVLGTHIPTSWMDIRAQITGFRGIGYGTGRIKSIDMQVTTTVKGIAREKRITIGHRPHLYAV
ncbi:hypothetical protein N7326_03055 [Corynebacterium sp. ES2794-CONJ1]|uniref:hypothetical protein n=1 Tax=Corynebacterium sp. ES2794-CONJ1 TaxID=2980553 RepID=UPI0021DB7E1A|nr:hypothetical protein [Corynebacterium sp. ES2794-CONJ1]MCU9518853.1 hypothetical protein [Corynebacterium sp. ES2794-CONJ1]